MSESGLISCSVENISQGGLFVRTAKLLSLGSPVRLNLVKPGMKRALQLDGSVASKIEMPGLVGMGVRFAEPHGEEAQRLQGLLAELGVHSVGPPLAPVRAVPAHPSRPAPAEAHRAPDEVPQASQPAHEVVPEVQRLMMQIQGLLMELGEAQTQLDVRAREVEDLRSENEDLKKELAAYEKGAKRR